MANIGVDLMAISNLLSVTGKEVVRAVADCIISVSVCSNGAPDIVFVMVPFPLLNDPLSQH